MANTHPCPNCGAETLDDPDANVFDLLFASEQQPWRNRVCGDCASMAVLRDKISSCVGEAARLARSGAGSISLGGPDAIRVRQMVDFFRQVVQEHLADLADIPELNSGE